MKKSQQSKKPKKNNFLNDFIDQEMYLQNPLLATDKFIDFCKKRGIQTTKEELEFFKKEKLLLPIGIKKGVILYSSFQIYWFKKLKQINSIYFTHNKTDFTLGNCEIKTENGKVFLNANLNLKIEISSKEEISLLGGKIYKLLKHKKALIDRFKSGFDLDTKKIYLRKEYEEFNIILKFLLSVQAVYFPYARSGGRTIQVIGDDKKWQEAKRNFKLNDELKKLNLKIKDIAEWYKIFSDEAQKILGIKRDDWVQLWKNVAWNEKDKLDGNIRLGVEYLQCAVMLKRIIEEHLQKEILDIDEMSNISADDILKIDTNAKDKPMVLLRHLRNIKYSDQDKNYYSDRYKRLFYLANDFGLDYQPRVTVFVEGKTEEAIFPEIFEQCIGNKPENLGIEFINFEGVDKLLSTARNSEKLRKLLQELQKQEKIQILSKSKNTELNQIIKDLNNIDIIISNWTSFLSYNLTKWQIIPFFISDNEGGIKHFLEAKEPIKYCNNTYNVPDSWKYLWGITNNNKPFQGKDFEMANFSDDEIAKVLSEILGEQIQPSDVQIQRKAEHGIKQINQDVEKYKIDIAKKLVGNLFDEYEKTKDKSLLGRPIFKALDKIANLAILNHPPVNREIELKNKEYFEKELQKT